MINRVSWIASSFCALLLAYSFGYCSHAHLTVSSALPEKKVTAEQTGTSKNGAINEVLNYRLAQKSADNLEKQTGVTRSSFIDEKTYLDFLRRVAANTSLQEAIKKAHRELIYVSAADRFETSKGGVIFINVKASDKEIITFLVGS